MSVSLAINLKVYLYACMVHATFKLFKLSEFGSITVFPQRLGPQSFLQHRDAHTLVFVLLVACK